MFENFFPNADDFDEMAEHLASIAYALGGQVDVSTWSSIQKAVRLGIAPSIFPIGTQLMVNHSEYGNKQYTVVAHNHYKNAKDSDSPTMTLMCNEVLPPLIIFDSPEAFYCTNTELPVGVYNFTIPYTVEERESGTYYFETTNILPFGTSLYIPDHPDSPLFHVTAYHYPTRTYYGDYVVSKGNNGTSLGTFGVELNHTHRIDYGSNNYKESPIRQFLNSASESGNWTSQTKYDRPPNWVNNVSGFLKGLDAELRDTLVEVIVPCSANNTFESPDSDTKAGESYTVVDKVFLPSATELGCFGNGITNDSETLPYFKNATNDMRIKYDNDTTPRFYWTRTPENNTSFSMEIINSSGKATSRKAVEGSYVTPMFNIG